MMKVERSMARGAMMDLRESGAMVRMPNLNIAAPDLGRRSGCYSISPLTPLLVCIGRLFINQCFLFWFLLPNVSSAPSIIPPPLLSRLVKAGYRHRRVPPPVTPSQVQVALEHKEMDGHGEECSAHRQVGYGLGFLPSKIHRPLDPGATPTVSTRSGNRSDPSGATFRVSSPGRLGVIPTKHKVQPPDVHSHPN
jgi:hypothetical protein